MKRPALRISLLAVTVLLVASACAWLLLRRSSLEHTEKGAYSATFMDPNEWHAFGGSWTHVSGEVSNTAEERGAKLIRRYGSRADYQVDADLQMDDAQGDAGLILRSSDEEEGVDSYRGYLASIKPSLGLIQFGRANFGWQLLTTQSFQPSTNISGWFHLHVVAVGCDFTFQVTFADGASVSTNAKDPSCLVAGRTGLRSSSTSARWRNLRIQPANAQDLQASQWNVQGIPAWLAGHPETNLSPVWIDRSMAAMRQEAMKHVFPKRIQYISDFGGPPGRGPVATIVGTVISTPPLLIVQDYTGSIIVSDYVSQTPLKLGDMVEVEATLVREGLGRHMEGAKIRILWSDVPTPPLVVTASQLADGTYRGRAIAVEGTLLSSTARAGGYEFVLTDQNYIFLAIGSQDFRVDPRSLRPGSRLRMRGVATVSERFTKNTYPFAVVADQVDLIAGPPWWSTRHLIWLAAGILAIFAGLSFLMHSLQQWRMRSVLREREQLALEMHDTLAQSFTGIGYQLQAASQERRGESHIQSHILSALQMVRLSHREASRTISSLRPQYRDAAAIVTSLKESAERLIDGGDLRIRDSLTGPNLTLPLAVTDAFFRIGQEAVSNAIQHGRCRTLTIQLSIGRKHSCLTVTDDGNGFDVDAVHEGLGLGGMKSRAKTAKVDFEIHSATGKGTTVSIRARHSPARGLFDAALGKLTISES